MQIFVSGRQAGKTTQAIKLASEENLYIICPDVRQVSLTWELAHKLRLPIPFPITWQEFLEKKYYGSNINGFVIDNLDMCIQAMTAVPIHMVTLTGKNPKEIKKDSIKINDVLRKF